ncbi:MAG: hypothetical protein ABIP68_06285, partial [Ferruginibacter sp.]
NITVEIKGLGTDAAPVTATRPEQMRRMKEMAAMGGGMAQFYAQMPDEVNLTVNGNSGRKRRGETKKPGEKPGRFGLAFSGFIIR